MRNSHVNLPSITTLFRSVLPALVILAMSAQQARAQADLMRIEEDWELELAQPDQQLDAPQVLIVCSPFGEASTTHFEIDINHASLPTYLSGGMQIRALRGEECLSSMRLLEGLRLTVTSDVVRWTQIVEKQGTGYVLGVANGTSTSWGNFGDSTSYVRVANTSEDFQYSPATSVAKSGVIYASNRVKSLSLKRVRLVNSLGQSSEIQLDVAVQ